MASMIYASGRRLAASTGLRWEDAAARFGALLTDDTYTPKAEHATVADVRGELSGGGYQRATLTSRAMEGAADAATLTADNVAWTGLSGAAITAWLVVYADGPSDDARPLVAAYPFRVLAAGDVEARWSNQPRRGTVLRLG